MKITVTQAHIDNGVRSFTHCPIALAIKEQTKGRVLVCGSAFITKNGVETVYSFPDSATNFVSAFDNNRSVHPFEFEMTEQR